MKILAFVLILFGLGNIIKGIIMLSQAPPDLYGEAVASIFMGIAFFVGSAYTFHRIKKKQKDKEEKDKWEGKLEK